MGSVPSGAQGELLQPRVPGARPGRRRFGHVLCEAYVEVYETDKVLTPLAMTNTAFAWTSSLSAGAATPYHPLAAPSAAQVDAGF